MAQQPPANFLALPGQRFFNEHYATFTAAGILLRRALALCCVGLAIAKYRAPIGAYPVITQESDPSVPLEERAMLARGVAVVFCLLGAMLWLQSLPPVAGGAWSVGDGEGRAAPPAILRSRARFPCISTAPSSPPSHHHPITTPHSSRSC